MVKWDKPPWSIALKQVSFETDVVISAFPSEYWGITESNRLVRLKQPNDGYFQNTPWFPLTGGGFRQVSLGVLPEEGRLTAWGLTIGSKNNVLRLNERNYTWIPVPGSLKQISVGTAGIWGVNSENEIFRWKDDSMGHFGFEQIGGSLKQVASGKNSVWGINSKNRIFRWSGGSGTDDSWERIGGSLVQIDVGDTACGVNDKGRVLRWNGGDKTGNHWEKLPAELTASYVTTSESGEVCALDTEGYVWMLYEGRPIGGFA